MKRNVLGILLAGAIGAALITGCGAASSGTAADAGISPGGWRSRQISREHPRPDRPYPDDLLRGRHDKAVPGNCRQL